MIAQPITREFAHQARRHNASGLPAIPRCVGPALEPTRASSWATPLPETCPAPLRVPLAEIMGAAA